MCYNLVVDSTKSLLKRCFVLKLKEKIYIYFRTIYEKLGVAFTEEVRALYQQRVDEIVPNLRYCSYNIGDESAFDDLVQMRIKGGDDDLTMKLDVGF